MQGPHEWCTFSGPGVTRPVSAFTETPVQGRGFNGLVFLLFFLILTTCLLACMTVLCYCYCVMGIDDLLKEKKGEILRIAEKHGAFNVRVFGSVARGEAGPDSDVDILVDVGTRTSSFFPGGLVADLEELLGRRVEIVTMKGLNRLIRDRVLKEAVAL